MLNFKTAVAATVLTSINVKQVEDFVNGLLTGLVQDDSLTKVQACLTDVKSVETDLTNAIADFTKGDIAGIVDGAKQVAHLLTKVEGDITDCKGMKGDADRIEKWTAIFNDPNQLMQTILANSMANISGLKEDIGDISTEVKNDDFKGLGMNIADIMTKTLGPVPESALTAAAFPAFDGLHANCAMRISVQGSCAAAYTALDTIVKQAAFDPAGGNYAVVQETASTNLWVTRTTPTKGYVDDIEFDLKGLEGYCHIHARSRSQSPSYYDYDTNYCNMYNVFRSSTLDFSGLVEHLATSECAWIPRNQAAVETACNKY